MFTDLAVTAAAATQAITRRSFILESVRLNTEVLSAAVRAFLNAPLVGSTSSVPDASRGSETD